MQFIEQQRARVGRQIRRARKDAGLSHDQLAERVGSSRQHLIKLEKGKHLPGPRLLTAIARETGKSEAFFETDSEDDEELDAMAALTRAVQLVVRETLNQELETQRS